MSLWTDYTAAHPEFAEETPPVDHFGDSPALADELLDLVLNGPKRATAGLAEQEIPEIGSHWVVTDGEGRERAILRTREIRVGRLDSVDDAFAWDEGEGDRSRDYWLRGHRTFFRRTADRPLSDEDLDSLPVVFERFDLVWPPER